MQQTTRDSAVPLLADANTSDLQRATVLSQSQGNSVIYTGANMSMRFSTSTGSVSPLDHMEKRSDSVDSNEFGRRSYRAESLGSQDGRGRLIEQTCKNAI